MRILLVEDDLLLGDGVEAGLRQTGFTVDWTQDGISARHALSTTPYDGVILDINLPRLSGLDLLRELRRANNAIPVLLLTARDTVEDRIKGLDAGADDYLVKPFALGELVARLRAVVRRASGRASPVLEYQGLAMNPSAHTATFNGESLEFTAKEFQLLVLLMDHRNQVLSRQQIEENLYGWNQEVASNAVEVHIHHVRKKLGSQCIRTLRGVGYQLGQLGQTAEESPA